jgi:hypothetical protein
MNRAALTVGAMLLLVGAAAWLAWQGGGEPTLPPPADVTAPGEDPAAVASGTAVDATVDGPGAPAPTEVAERDAVVLRQSLLPPPDDARWIEVRVVDATSKQPVPGATVGWYDQRIGDELQKRPQLLPHPYGFTEDHEAVALAFGWTTTADQRGIARIQQARGTWAFARADDRYGTARLDRDQLAPKDGFQIAIESDHALRVQVLTATGEPAVGVPVGIAIFDAKDRPQRLRRWGPETLSMAPDGIAEIPHAQHLRRFHAESTKRGGTWRLAALLPFVVGETDPIVLDPPAQELLTLRLPPTGSLRVRTVAPDPNPELNGIWLRGKSEGRPEVDRAQLHARFDADGWARFRYVPLGQQFHVSAMSQGGWLNNEVFGPAAAGLEVEVVLAPGQKDIQVAGRILDEQRQPLADTNVQIRLLGRRFGGERNLRTDADGRFQMLAGPASTENDDKVDGIVVRVVDESHGQRIARAPGRTLRPGIEQVGDLVLDRDPLVVAGRFTVDGVPAKPELHPQIERHEPREDAPDRWRNANLTMPQIAADGRFEVRGVAEPGRYRLQLYTTDLQRPEPIEFALGTKDLTVPLRSGGMLALSVLLPEGGRTSLEGKLVPNVSAQEPTSAIAASSLQTASRGAGGRQQLTWRALSPGRYRVELRTTGFPEPLVAIDDVAVPATQPPDPRLVDIDLTTVLRLQQLALLGADGKPLDLWSGVLLPMPQDGAERLLALPPEGLQNGFLLPNRPVELMAAFRGYQPQRILCNGAPLEVRMVPWPTVTLTLPTLPDWPKGWVLHASLEEQPNLDARHFHSEWSSGPIANLIGPPTSWSVVADGRVELAVGEVPQRIRLQARKDRQTVPLPLAPQAVSMATGTYQVQLDPDAVLKALAAAPKKGG